MLTADGINRIKGNIKRMAQREDAEVNAVLQAAIIGLNRLKSARFPSLPPTP